jgi:uncharacterized OB-fold protein
LASVIRIDANGGPYLEGARCSACGEVLVARGRACPKCATVGALSSVRLADHGKLYAYTIVHRSFPGVETPIISAVVRLEGGGFLKGNLSGVAAEPDAIPFDMPVQIVFEFLPARDEKGGRLVRYLFVPKDGGAVR